MDNISINDILNLVSDYSEEELNKIKKAYEYASNLHSHQFRERLLELRNKNTNRN